MSASKPLLRKPHVVAIVGPTGSGKSQLAIDLAHTFNGEVVNADVIQMYAGLDIASAKVTPDEMAGVPHHLMSFLLPQQVFTVRDFHAMAMDVISDITARGRLPIVVGGTSYYVQSLLRPSLLEVDEARAESAAAAGMTKSDDVGAAAASASADSAGPAKSAGSRPDYSYERLQAVDPVMARRLHPNDSRKIARALEVWDRTGVPYSQMLLRQKERLEKGSASAGASTSAGSSAAAALDETGDAMLDASEGLASSSAAAPAVVADEPLHALVIWTTVANKATHNARLDARVAKMMRCGLTDELQRLHAYLAGDAGANSSSSCDDASLAAQLAAAASALSLTGQRPTELTLRTLQSHIATRNRSLQAPSTGAAGAGSADHPGPPSADAAAGGAGAASSSSGSSIIGYTPPTLRPPASLFAASSSADPDHDGAASGHDSSAASYQGLLQAIGYKEFAAYLQLLAQSYGQGSSGGNAAVASSRATAEVAAASGSAPAEAAAVTAGAEVASVSSDAAPSSKRPRLGSADASKVTEALLGTPADISEPAKAEFTAKRGKKTSVSATAAASGSHEAALAAALQDGVRRLTEVTHRYARVQERFIRNRFLKRGIRMRVIDTSGGATGPAAWLATVAGPAERSVRAWLAGGSGLEEQEAGGSAAAALAADGSAAAAAGGTGRGSKLASAAAAAAAAAARDASSLAGAAGGAGSETGHAESVSTATEPADAAVVDDVTRVFTWQKHTCDVCGGRVLNGEKEWADHLRSRGHTGAVKHAAMRAKLLAERGIVLPERKRRGSLTGHATHSSTGSGSHAAAQAVAAVCEAGVGAAPVAAAAEGVVGSSSSSSSSSSSHGAAVAAVSGVEPSAAAVPASGVLAVSDA